eukprot:scaffold18.g1890.t1
MAAAAPSPRAAAAAAGAADAAGDDGPGPSLQQVKAAWAWFRGLGSPKYWVAPMVDQSELAFRELCRRHGATAAYTPMLHARLFCQGAPYRAEHFTTCETDRPLLAQFCANDPATFAAKYVQHCVDGVDLNLGCPQHIASRGRYGAYLMDDLPLVERLVRHAVAELQVPVTVKIRRFDSLEKTVAYARMLEAAGASLLAIHGRTRQQKQAKESRADWEYIRAVKEALSIPVLGNGNIRTLADAEARELMASTGVDGVMSAESLLEDPALFSPRRLQQPLGHLDGVQLLLEYCDICEARGGQGQRAGAQGGAGRPAGRGGRVYPQPWRMVKGHAFKLLGPWLSEFVDVREVLSTGDGTAASATIDHLRSLTHEVLDRIAAIEAAEGRTTPRPQLSAKKLEKLEREARRAAAIAEQEREEVALAEGEREGAALAKGETEEAALAAAGQR